MRELKRKKQVSPIDIYIGFDQKEAVAYHVCTQSLIENSTVPLKICPLAYNNLGEYFPPQSDGSNKFIYSRFLVPMLNDYKGWAIFMDGDMIINCDIGDMLKDKSDEKAIYVVKHDYRTKFPVKYLGNKNENYHRKNWSSVILWNCSHPANLELTVEKVCSETGKYLHRFVWLNDDQIGELDIDWNWLAMEYDEKSELPNLVHYTVGTPCFKDYSETDYSSLWKSYYNKHLEGMEY